MNTMAKRNIWVGAGAFTIAALMLGAAFAAVPLYDMFCRVTGFGGKTMVATAAPQGGVVLNHPIDIRFDLNIGQNLPITVEADVSRLTVNPGEPQTVLFKLENLANEPLTMMAAYNVAPTTVGQFFNKLQCFCFSEQTLKPKEKTEFALVFFIDPAIVQDADDKNTQAITLSYSFYRQKAAKPVAFLSEAQTMN